MTALSLGASWVQVAYRLLQVGFAVLGALVAAFGRVTLKLGCHDAGRQY